jgi:flagellar biosynthetic protein FliP
MIEMTHQGKVDRPRTRALRAWTLLVIAWLGAGTGVHADDRTSRDGGEAGRRAAAAVPPDRDGVRTNQPAILESDDESPLSLGVFDRRSAARSLQTVGIFGLITLAPVGLLMLTGFIRISIVLTLLRQALGSPQVPGNQVITALSLLLTALVMWPYGDRVYREAVSPYAEGRITPVAAWDAGSRPIKEYMLKQLDWTRHQGYLETLYEFAAPGSPGRAEPPPQRPEDFPLRVIAPAFLLSELTTGLVIGFYVYLPFLVVDLVVSAVLAATGLFMLPPALVATPIKLILFVLAGGWILIATMLLTSFGPPGG